MKALIKWLPVKSKEEQIKDLAIIGKTIVSFKYFALTQDIKVKDRVLLFDKDNIYDEVVANKVEKEEFKQQQQHWYKIIGEVSPYATFVDDGEEYEVKVKPYRTYRDSGKITPTGQHEQELYTKDIAYVECPCCKEFL